MDTLQAVGGLPFVSNVIVWCSMHYELRIINEAIFNNQWRSKKIYWMFIHLDQLSYDQFSNYIRKYNESFLINRIYSCFPECFPIQLKGNSKFNALRRKNIKKPNEYVYPLNEHHLKIGVVEYAPMFTTLRNGTQITYSGYVVDIIHVLSRYLGFSFEFVIETNGVFGSRENGTWNGVVGMLSRKEVDIGAAGFVLTASRMEAVQYSAYLHLSSTVAVIRKSKEANYFHLDTYLQPFDTDLWFMVIVMWLFVSIFFASVPYLHGNHAYFPVPYKAIHYFRSQATSLWLLMCVMLQMGLSEVSKSRVIQIILVFFLAFALIVNKSYVSLLTAALTVKKTTALYNDMDELLDDGKYGICILPFESTYQAMKESQSGTLQRIWKNINQDKKSIVKTLALGFNKVYNERYVFLAGARPAAHIMKSNCSFEILKKHYLQSAMHFLLQKNSALKEIISVKIHSLRSSGILWRLDNLHLTDQADLFCRNNNLSSVIRMQVAIGAFVILGIGVLASAICFFLEMAISYNPTK